MSQHQEVNETSRLIHTDECSEEVPFEEILFAKWWSIFAPINWIRRWPTKILYPLLIILTIVINSIIYFPLKNIVESIHLKGIYKDYMIMINTHASISSVIPIMIFDIIIWKFYKSEKNRKRIEGTARDTENINIETGETERRTDINGEKPAYPGGFNVVLCNVYKDTNSVYNVPNVDNISKNIQCFVKNFLFSWVFVAVLTCYQCYIVGLLISGKRNTMFEILYPRFYPGFILYFLNNFFIVLYWIICRKFYQDAKQLKKYIKSHSSPIFELSFLNQIQKEYYDLKNKVKNVNDCVKWFAFFFVLYSALNIPMSQLYYWIIHKKLNTYSFDIVLILWPSIFVFTYTLYLAINIPIELNNARDELENKVGVSTKSQREDGFLDEYNNVKEFISKPVCLNLGTLQINTAVFTVALIAKFGTLITYIPGILTKDNSTAAVNHYNYGSNFNFTDQFIYFY